MTEEQFVANLELAECLEVSQLLKQQLAREHVKVGELLREIERLQQAEQDERDRIEEMQERNEAMIRAVQKASDALSALRELLVLS